MIDLHIHTYYSDGSKSVKEIFQDAKRSELEAISITDHNSIKGYKEAYKESQDTKIEFIPGVEISCINQDGLLTEILGYLMDIQDKRFDVMLKRAEKYYYNPFRKALKHLEESRNGGRGYHVLKKFYHYFKANYFMRVLAKSLVFNSLDAVEAIKTIKALGGISVLSHPRNRRIRIIDNEEILKLVWQGLDGIEVYHPGHTDEDIQELLRLSRENNLLITGGSDYHGKDHGKRYVGCCSIEDSLLGQIKARSKDDIKTNLHVHEKGRTEI